MLKPINILLVGVGGQGTILATRILAEAARTTGYDIKVSEIKGMAQRGGSVVTQVRLGEKVFSPLIDPGHTDVMVAFEKLEALRWHECLTRDGILIVNNQEIPPMPVLTGAAVYPDNIIAHLQGQVKHLLVVDALDLALQCGNAKTANVVLVGLLAKKLPIEKEIWLQAIKAKVAARFIEVNLQAFAAGYSLEQ